MIPKLFRFDLKNRLTLEIIDLTLYYFIIICPNWLFVIQNWRTKHVDPFLQNNVLYLTKTCCFPSQYYFVKEKQRKHRKVGNALGRNPKGQVAFRIVMRLVFSGGN